MKTCLPLLVTLAVFGCTPELCTREKLPNNGIAATPENLAAIVRQEANNECWSEMYDQLSAKTRDTYGRAKWWIAISSVKIPEYDYRVVDVVSKGKFLGALANPTNPHERFALYDYEEPGKKPLHANVLLLLESDEWRVGLEDQKEHVEAGDGRYWWFDLSVPENAGGGGEKHPK
jgi:hypothetical protein